ncbi:MAG: DUF4367 domain-containing protein [Oscillospiraceae bacterium]|nr:DUF4367 domain-containing protein [Oscillospiraceae bacterium]
MYNLSEKAIAEKYEDLLFTKVMALYAAEESEKILSEIKNEEPADPKNIEKIYSKTERRENLSVFWKVSKKLITFAAMIVFVAVVSLSSVVVASAEAREAVAEAIYHLVLRKTDRYTEVSIGNSTGFIDPEIYTWDDAYAPTYMPEGFELSNFSCTSSQQTVDYVFGEDFINFIQARNSTGQIDTENADITKEIQIGETKGFLVVKDDWSCVTCSIEDILIQVSGTAPTEEIIKIAESLKPIGYFKTEEPEGEYTFIDPEIYTWENAYGMTYVPETYYLKEYIDIETERIITYSDKNNEIIFSQATDATVEKIDTENADITKEIQIGESVGLFVVKNNVTIIAWSNEDFLFEVIGTAPTEEIIKVAEGIKPIGKTATEEPAEESEFIDEDVFYWNGAYAPTYIPEDFEITSKDYLNDTCAITYSKGGESFVIYQITGSATISVDTENADISKEIKINNSSGLYVVKDNNCSISWNEGKTLLWLTGEVDEKELLKVAEGMKFTGENKVPKEYPFFDPENYDWEGAFAPTFVPEGFVFSDMQKGENVKLATYTFENSYFYFTQTKNLSYARIDTEDAEIDTKGFIGNSEALFVHEKGFSSVVWSVGDTYFSVEGMISLYDAVKIAQHIRPIN